ncbi:hypothetical protein V1503_24065 [Bacillus sp. SCS-151]|uniref:hypothetical protein n=1 Tax=Nanhaiella sioensis TaxID=3115293 RepID=UPI00397C17E3
MTVAEKLNVMVIEELNEVSEDTTYNSDKLIAALTKIAKEFLSDSFFLDKQMNALTLFIRKHPQLSLKDMLNSFIEHDFKNDEHFILFIKYIIQDIVKDEDTFRRLVYLVRGAKNEE